jgi:hypothetical protein
MDYQIQVVTVPVTDADQAAAFYTQQAGFADFADPDGNTWILQEIGYRGPASPRGLPG